MAVILQSRHARFTVRSTSLLPGVLLLMRGLDAVIERRDCGTGAGGFKPGNKCAGGGGGGSSGGGDGGDDTVGTGGGGADAPAHVEGSKAYENREKHRRERKKSDYPPSRDGEVDTSLSHTTTPRFDASGNYVVPDGPDDWTPQRQAMHREIIADAVASVPRSAEPTLYMMGGGPAAGKSSIIKSGEVKHPDKHVLANPDEFKADIPEYRDGLASGDLNAARFAHEESSYLNRQAMAAARGGGQDVVWDGTGDNSIEKLEKQVKGFRDAGYRVQADYVTCDTETAVQRSKERGKKTGRDVPEDAIRQTHAKVSEIWPVAVSRGLFDQSELYDTTSGGKPVRIASARGTQLTIHDKEAYDRFLAKAKPGRRRRR